MLGCKVAVLSTNILEFSSRRVHNLDVASQVLVTPDLAELIEGKVGDIAQVKFVVP